MKIGTIDTLEPEKIRRKPILSIGSGDPPNGNNGRGKGGGGSEDDGPWKGKRQEISRDNEEQSTPDKAKVVTWFLLLVVLMTFGGLIGAYVVISTNNVLEWRPFTLPMPIWVSTALILLSSIAYSLSRSAVEKGNDPEAKRYLLITTGLGGTFIASQLIAWMALVNAGLYMSGNPYAGFFYILTGLHAIHVIGGMIALGAILLRVWVPTMNESELTYRRNLARSVGWYWHFMGFLWLLIVFLLGFWK